MNSGRITKTLLVIGWTFLIISVLSIISGILCLVIFFAFRNIPAEEMRAFSENTAQTDPASLIVLNYAGVLAFAQIIPAIIIMIISIFFLRLRAWARIGIEIICWAGIAYSAFALIVICGLSLSRIPALTSYTKPVDIVLSIALTIAAAIPLRFITKYLRRQDIRILFTGSDLNI